MEVENVTSFADRLSRRLLPHHRPWQRTKGRLQKQAGPGKVYGILCRFILDYFGQSLSAAQKGYEKLVSQLVGQDYESPLKDVFGSALLGSQPFIDFIKKEFISNQKSNRGVPAIRQFADQISIIDVCEAVDSAFGETPRLSRKIKIYLCRKLTAVSLKTIGEPFGIGDSAVAQSYSRFFEEIKADRRLGRQVAKIEKQFVFPKGT